MDTASNVFAYLGGQILPYLLRPLQTHRFTAQQLLDKLNTPHHAANRKRKVNAVVIASRESDNYADVRVVPGGGAAVKSEPLEVPPETVCVSPRTTPVPSLRKWADALVARASSSATVPAPRASAPPSRANWHGDSACTCHAKR